MAFRTEVTLEDLLAEPIVVAMMRRDGIVVDEARALYDSVALRIEKRAKRGPSKRTKSSGRIAWTKCWPDHMAPRM